MILSSIVHPPLTARQDGSLRIHSPFGGEPKKKKTHTLLTGDRHGIFGPQQLSVIVLTDDK